MERIILHREDKRRFETVEDGFTAYLDYELKGNEIEFTHTVVPSEIGSRGIAADLVQFSLEYAGEKGYRVLPTCHYVRTFIERHMDKYGNLTDNS